MSQKDRTLFWLWLTLFLLVLVAIPFTLMLGRLDGHMLGMMGTVGYGWGWVLMPLVTVVFLTLLALGAYYLITAIFVREETERRDAEKPLDILKKRYARGEITKEQFEEMRKEFEQ